ncbi:hypothetical protein BVY04_00805 [bacterium M21]|nr:hypothetical protein BVY04_00805 [bacterium M21]
MIIDFHTHAFPDDLAVRAVEQLSEMGEEISAHTDGTVDGLIGSMDRAGVDASVLANIATKPEHFGAIMEWAADIRSERVIPFASLHPTDPEAPQHVAEIADAGLKGLKLHPYYQQFVLDAPEVIPIYRAICEQGLVLLAHTGFDIGFPFDRICDPTRILHVLEQVPGLKLVCGHLGGWSDWDEVERLLLGKEIYLDLAVVRRYLGEDRLRKFLLRHSPDHILFGTDSPWSDQAEEVVALRAMKLPTDLEVKILGQNAERLLGLG